ncbi:5'-3' exonuclease-like protein [Genlisea aurea]|uniref:5'-3' exonuclease-like protein n=1 Tax=Genlisea aurea TaxID=192259 RepID=S8CV81_9LAMI|nr:5'-3' exonuclease-like protein [Genlisea aurea]
MSRHHLLECRQQIPLPNFANPKSNPPSSSSSWKPPGRDKGRVFLLDVNPLCYAGNSPSLTSFAHWTWLLFSTVTFNDPVIAVLDGEGGNDRRREVLPSYKAHRRRPNRERSSSSRELVRDVLERCNVPVVRIEGQEADDVIATLVDKAVSGKGRRAVIASPDKDFKQLVSERVQIVAPVPELGRWSFYTLKHYVAQYNCDPRLDLSLRSMLGDETDGVPGIQNFAPGFGRKTALKLLKKHGSLEELLAAAGVRTVGRNYAQEALTRYGAVLLRNHQVLSLKRDVDVELEDQWLSRRDVANDSVALSSLRKRQ